MARIRAVGMIFVTVCFDFLVTVKILVNRFFLKIKNLIFRLFLELFPIALAWVNPYIVRFLFLQTPAGVLLSFCRINFSKRQSRKLKCAAVFLQPNIYSI